MHLNISGHITFPQVKANSTEVYNQQLSHSGTLVLVEGDYTSVGGLNRRQIFMIDVSGATATLTGWTSPQFDGSDPNGTLNANDKYFNCGASHPFYVHAAAWSPDDSEDLPGGHRGQAHPVERHVPDAGDVRRGGGVPGHADPGLLRLDRLRRL